MEDEHHRLGSRVKVKDLQDEQTEVRIRQKTKQKSKKKNQLNVSTKMLANHKLKASLKDS